MADPRSVRSIRSDLKTLHPLEDRQAQATRQTPERRVHERCTRPASPLNSLESKERCGAAPALRFGGATIGQFEHLVERGFACDPMARQRGGSSESPIFRQHICRKQPNRRQFVATIAPRDASAGRSSFLWQFAFYRKQSFNQALADFLLRPFCGIFARAPTFNSMAICPAEHPCVFLGTGEQGNAITVSPSPFSHVFISLPKTRRAILRNREDAANRHKIVIYRQRYKIAAHQLALH